MSRPSALLLTGVLVAAACSGRGSSGSSEVAPAPHGQEILRPGDIIRLRIWREPDLTGDFPVDEFGSATLPKLGPVRIDGFSRDSLRAYLVESYSAYLRNPSIEVALLRRINVLGAVRTPGLYPVDPTMTVADALALAGGAAPDGRADEVELVRGGTRIRVDLNAATRLADTPIQSGDQLVVPERSWFSRNLGLVVGTATAFASLMIAISR